MGSSVTFWYTGEELEHSETDGLYNLIGWCNRQINYQVGKKELEPQSPRFEVIELLDDTIEECQRILASRKA